MSSEPRLTFEVFTLFPEAIAGFVQAGLLGKAVERGLVDVHCTNFRDFTTDRHRTVDDAPFGGGAGMVIKPEPVVAALEHVERERGPMHKILLTPSAPRFDQRVAERLAQHARIALLCGRYEGIDDRVREHFVDECLSIGDFILGGGEVAALTVIEAVSRLGEGVLGNPESIATESFAASEVGGLLEHPQFTRPAEFRGLPVPAVLLGGDHEAIRRWRHAEALRRTWKLRPDLRASAALPAGTPIHLACPADIEPPDPSTADALVELVRRHRIAGIALVGGRADAVMPWVRAVGGRIPITGFGDAKTMLKRLKPRGGAAPWVVALAEDGPAAISDPRELLDRLDPARAPADKALVLWLGEAVQGPLDATFAPASPNDLSPPVNGLAIDPRIVDISPPCPRLVRLADRALAQLFSVPPVFQVTS